MTRKIKILYTIPNFVTAGSQYVLLAIFKHLDSNIFHPKVLVEKHPDIFPELIKKEDQLYLPLEEKPKQRINKLAKILKKQKIDILHSWDYKSTSIEALACRKAGVKYIYTKKNNAWSKRWFIKSILSHHIAYDNPEMKIRFFSSFWLKRKATFIPHGVDISVFKPFKKNTHKNFIIGCIGVLGENKNQLFLLKALSRLPDDIYISFYGKSDTDYLEKMNRFIKENKLENRVSINDFVANTEIPKLMQNFSVLALASKNEGLPVSLLEAMACGVPVLSSDSGGGASYILKDNEGGFIFKNEPEFIERIFRLKNDHNLLRTMSEKAISRVENDFTLKQEILAYQKLYLQLV